MHDLLNTLYVQTQGAFLRLEHDAVRVTVKGETKARFPLLRLNGIVGFGQVMFSPFLIHRCAEDGRDVVWLTRHGRFRARVAGPARGNVLLRRAQHLALSDRTRVAAIARQFVAGKIHNSRQTLMRSARDATSPSARESLVEAASRLGEILMRLRDIEEIEVIRGAEGEAARSYFAVFNQMVRASSDTFIFSGRSRRPPRDAVNALLSFLYTLLRGDCEAALEGVGLDPQVGFLHALRPGRPALALDLMEELRAPVADRLALTLINRQQLREQHFEEQPGGAIYLNEEGRRAVLTAWQERKAEEIEHRILQQKMPLGLVPHLQARLLARHLRNDLADYPPYVSR